MPVSVSTVPAVPSPLVTVELADAGASAATTFCYTAATVAADAGGSASFGPGAAELLDPWRQVIQPTGRAGELRAVPMRDRHAWLIGVGTRTSADWRSAGATLARAVRDVTESQTIQVDDASGPAVVDVVLPVLDVGELTALVFGLILGGYRFAVTGRLDAAADSRPPTFRLCVQRSQPDTTAALDAAVRRAAALAAATALARDLANMPSNIKDPAWLAATAAQVVPASPALTVAVRDEAWLAEHGFGGLLAVGGGSASPPRLVELTWCPPDAERAPHLVLVGKGITFDTGGLSIKPAENMHLMRTDMSGAAAVIAALRAVAELELPVRVTGLVPCAENHVSGSAYRPGDVLRHYGGTTTEITNTDAEGRIVLADTLAYAVDRHRPDLLIDVATLTGAMKVSLGLRTGGLFASEPGLAQRITCAGAAVGERLWWMPLPPDAETIGAELSEAVHSDIADVRQCPPGPGGITAAMFLREFTGGVPWAHLDIAGPARADKPYAEVVAGGTGFAARTLVAVAESLLSVAVV